MHKSKWANINRMTALAGVMFTGLMCGPVNATDVTIEELRGILVRAADISAKIRPSQYPLRESLESLPYETLEVLQNNMGDVTAFSDSIDRLEAAMQSASSPSSQSAELVSFAAVTTSDINRGDNDPLDPPKPAYPESGGSYQIFTDTLSGLGALSDSDGDGRLNDERCGADYEADLQIALAFNGSLAAVTAGCDALPPGAKELCHLGSVAFAVIVHGFEIAATQCELQDALVDSAEIEAAFENTVILYDKLSGVDDKLSGVESTVNNTNSRAIGINEKIQFMLVMLGNHVIDADEKFASHDADIKNALNVHGTNITNTLNTHDTNISNSVSTHDNNMNVLLANIQNDINTNTGLLQTVIDQQLEVIRLLHTPQGVRSSQVPACRGSGCDFPEK